MGYIRGKTRVKVDRRRIALAQVLFAVYQLIAVGTAIYLTFFNDYVYTWWNWIIVVPINVFLGQIWPIYWTVLQWM